MTKCSTTKNDRTNPNKTVISAEIRLELEDMAKYITGYMPATCIFHFPHCLSKALLSQFIYYSFYISPFLPLRSIQCITRMNAGSIVLQPGLHSMLSPFSSLFLASNRAYIHHNLCIVNDIFQASHTWKSME